MTLTLDKAGERLDSALSRLVPELTRSQAQRLIEQGAVTRDGRPVKKNEKLPAGTTLELAIPEVRETPIAAQEIPLEVCYEDADVIVVNKPKGLVVHPAPGHADGTLVNALLAHCGNSLSGRSCGMSVSSRASTAACAPCHAPWICAGPAFIAP